MRDLHALLRRALSLGALLVLLLGAGAVAHAAGSATIRDDAALFTAAGRARIEQAAAQANLRVVVITNKQSFASRAAWHTWLQGQATDPNAITIGLHAVRKQQDIYTVPGANTGLSQAQANQGIRDTLKTFNSAGVTAGVVQLIQDYRSMGATAPGGSTTQAPAPSGGIGWGWLVPVIIVVLILFVLSRLLGARRRAMSGYGPGPYNQYGGGPYPGYGGPGFGGGGGFGRGLLGGVLGGLGGAWLGNQLFGNRDNPNVSAIDPNAAPGGPTDTANAQSLQGGWTGGDGDGDGASQADAGGWTGGDGGGDDGWGGGDGGGWAGGDGGGDGGWS